MKRRDFLKKASIAGGAAFAINNIPMRVMAKSSFLQKAALASCNDRVLIIVQLHGGNDGLNTIVPLDQYDLYSNLRPTISLPRTGGSRIIRNLDATLPTADQVAYHPDLIDLKDMYDRGKVNIVQSVGYENLNQSHFRSRDIWFMGGGSDDYYESGWMGRYLTDKFPGYPDAYPSTEMPDPLAIEIGNGISLAFHTEDTIPASLSLQNPEAFYNLINGVSGTPGVPNGIDGSNAEPPTTITDTHYADELRWIMEFEKKSDQYAERLRDVYLAGNNSSVIYPEQYPFNAPPSAINNPLSGQLRLIARLLAGGCKTKIFLTRIGGFDTHAQQVEVNNPTYGAHAALINHVFSAVNAFQKDLESLGLDDRVMTLTVSEFGRRAASNSSYGTDHGKAAPMFVFGTQVNPGVTGTNPDLSNLDRGNTTPEVDYRQIFNEILEDWLCATDSEKNAVDFDQTVATPKLGVVNPYPLSNNDSFFESRYYLDSCYPNPVVTDTTFSYKINRAALVTLKLYDSKGSLVRNIEETHKMPGKYEVTTDLSTLEKGAYFYTLEAGKWSATKKLLKL